MSAAAVVATVALIGTLIGAAAFYRDGLRGRRLILYAAGVGPGVGLGLASFLVFFSRFLGLSRPGPRAWLLLTLAALVLVWSRRGRAPVPARVRPPLSRSGLVVSLVAFVALSASSFGMVSAYRSMARAWPDGLWDAVAIYNVRARLFYERYEDFPSTLKQVSAASHPHYPLLLPAAIAAEMQIRGADDPALSRLTGFAFVLGVGVLLFAILAEEVSVTAAAAGTAVLWATPTVWLVGFGQIADLAVAYYFLGSIAIAMSHTSQRDTIALSPLIGGFFLGCLMWTKNEGLILAALVVLCLCLFRPWRRSGSRADAAAAGGWLVAGALPGFAALWLLKIFWAPTSGVSIFLDDNWTHRVLSLSAWRIAARGVALRLLGIDSRYGWSWVWPVIVVGMAANALVSRGRFPSPTRYWLAVSLAPLVCWVAIYVLTPYDQAWHIATSIDRMLLQIYPALIVGSLLITHRRDGRLTSAEPTPLRNTDSPTPA